MPEAHLVARDGLGEIGRLRRRALDPVVPETTITLARAGARSAKVVAFLCEVKTWEFVPSEKGAAAASAALFANGTQVELPKKTLEEEKLFSVKRLGA